MTHPLIAAALDQARGRLRTVSQGPLFVTGTLERFAARPEIAGHEALAASWIELATTWVIEGISVGDYAIAAELYQYLTRKVAIHDLLCCANAAER